MRKIIESREDYVNNHKRVGNSKYSMINYIAGMFTNAATKNDCLKLVAKFMDITKMRIMNENEFRKSLRFSDSKVIRELYGMCKNRYDQIKTRGFGTLEENVDFKELDDFKQANSDLLDTIGTRIGDLESHLRDLVSSDSITLNQDQLDAISKLEKLNPTQLFESNVFDVLSTIKNKKVRRLIKEING